MTHPTLEELFEFSLARHRGERISATIERHLSTSCSHCQERLREIDLLMQAMITDRTQEPPAAWVARAIALFPMSSLATKLAEFGRGLTEEVGRLVFSSWGSQLPAFAGARGSSSIERLRFEAKGLELDLQVERTGRGGSLLGQLLRLEDSIAPCSGASLLATSAASHSAEAVSDELGEFQISLPDLADLRMRIAFEGRLIVFDIPSTTEA
jgi:hypothetical protein